MKLFIIDDNTEAEVFVYGIDGSDCTERFFVSFFDGKGIKKLTEAEKSNTRQKPIMPYQMLTASTLKMQ